VRDHEVARSSGDDLVLGRYFVTRRDEEAVPFAAHYFVHVSRDFDPLGTAISAALAEQDLVLRSIGPE
jgi:hypothetical protein